MKTNIFARLKKDLKKNRSKYILVIPVLLYYILFCYKPMYGVIIAFFDYRPARGIFGSDFVGLENFVNFFTGRYFVRTLRNTLLLSLGNLIFCFPSAIILALLLNEVKNMRFKKVTQTLTYLPHFISSVVICGMIIQFVQSDGLINDVIAFFGGERIPLLQHPEYFRSIYIISDIWQQIGWSSIIYLAALAAVDTQLYEAAKIDGAGKWKQMLHVTLPGILPTIMIQLILKIGGLMSVGYEKVLNLYNPSIYETADIISTYTYRVGIGQQDWSYSTAIGLFNSVVNCFLIVLANKISKRVTENSLW